MVEQVVAVMEDIDAADDDDRDCLLNQFLSKAWPGSRDNPGLTQDN